MRQPDGFLLGKCLVSNDRYEVYAAVRESDRREVVLKSPVALRVEGNDRLRREFEALRAVQGPGIVEALELLPGSILVLARVPGVSLSTWLKDGGVLRIEALLDVASGIAAALERVHAARWIHCDLTPGNVMVDPTTLEVQLIDFGLSRPLGAQSRSIKVSHLAGTLAYIAPEQTGRMSRGIDARSDLYSLGATLYCMLTGEPPFPLEDELGLVHAHMARVPRAPVEVRPDTPLVLSRLILKLLEKEPDARYQSARALLADLRRCREQLRERGAIDEAMPLAAAETPDGPWFSARLYGREAEMALLRDLRALAAAGSTQIIMLSGEAGVGKSSLVGELRRDIATHNGYLAMGKFDLARDRPYSGWITALEGLAQQWLVESDARLAEWRTALCNSLGVIAGALCDVVPDLAFVLGDVPAVPALRPRETQARLALALDRFITACATPAHPLVVFLDDLQWSDAASRELFERVAVTASNAALLIIGAYRTSEVARDHPLAGTLASIATRREPIRVLDIPPIAGEAAVALLSEALEREPTDVRGLAQLIERKTGNSPLLLREFVEHLHCQGLLQYHAGKGWVWDLDAVLEADIPDGAVAMMTEKLHRLEPNARAVIEFAACVGSEFDLDQLCELSLRERDSVERGLFALSDTGLILPSRNGFRFAHDRIREAARALLSEEARTELHYRIAQLLLERTREAERPARIFEIAEHLSRGLACLPESQRLEAARLQLAAARRAWATGAASSAEAFLAVGRELLRDEDWASEHALAFELILQSIDSAFLRGDFANALAWADALERQKLSTLEAAQVAARRIQVFALIRSPEDCARYGLEVLRRYGIRWPLYPSRLRVQLALRWAAWRLRGSRLQAALRPAPALPPELTAPLAVIGSSTMARVNAYLPALSCCWVIHFNLRYGCVSRPAYTIGAFVTYMQLLLGDTPEIDRLEKVALEELARRPDPIFGPKAEFNICALLRPWRMPRRRALAPLSRIADALQEVGDVEFWYYARFLKVLYSALAGDPIGEAGETMAELAAEIRRSSHLYPEPEICQRPLRLLAGSDLSSLESELAAGEAELTAAGGSVGPYARTAWLMALCVHGRWDQALSQSEALGERLFYRVPYVHVADHCFYRGLAAAALAGSRGAARIRHRRTLRTSLRRLRRWANAGPDFAHMVHLLEAEQARLARDPRRARALYEKAAQRAMQQQFPHHAALARERLALMYFDLRRRAEGTSVLLQAIALYEAWGSPAKVMQLRGIVLAAR
jgi:predicted ATPase